MGILHGKNQEETSTAPKKQATVGSSKMPKSDVPSGGEATTPKEAPKDAPKEKASSPAVAPTPESPKRKRTEDNTEGGEKKKAKKPQQDPPKRKRAAEEGNKESKPSKKSKPAPAPKPQGKKKKPTAKAATGANSTPLKARGAAKEKNPPLPTPAEKDGDDGKIDQEKVKNAPKLNTSAANSNWRNRDPEEKLGDVKILERDRALRRLNQVKKTLERRFRDLNQLCFDPYEAAFLDKEKGEDRRDPDIVEHLDLLEGLFARRDNEREDLRRRIMAFKDPQTWDEAAKALRRRKSQKRPREEEEEDGAGPDERVQGLVEVLRSIPALEGHVDKCEARVRRDAKRVRDDIALERKGRREMATRVYEAPPDRFAAKTLESVNRSIRKEDIENAKEVLARDEAPDEGPSEEGEEEESDDGSDKAKSEGQESEESAEYIQL